MLKSWLKKKKPRPLVGKNGHKQYTFNGPPELVEEIDRIGVFVYGKKVVRGKAIAALVENWNQTVCAFERDVVAGKEE